MAEEEDEEVVELLVVKVASSELRLVVEVVVLEAEDGEREDEGEVLVEGAGLEDGEEDKTLYYSVLIMICILNVNPDP